MPFLCYKPPSGELVEFRVRDRVIIGRGAWCDLSVDDDLVSRCHAEVTRRGDQFRLEDLRSKNGTRLNGVAIDSASLSFGDEIAVGNSRLVFAERSASDLPGTVLSGYEVVEQIASGGMGVVYRARQLSLDRTVALKVLHPRLVAQPTFVERFLCEARAAGALNHTNLVHVHDAGNSGGVYFYVMEFIDGPTVREELRREPMPPARAIHIVRQIADALAYVHAEGIIHRDVKPANIMLASDGTAKLADLGLARPIELAEPEAHRGTDGRLRIWGTAAYLPPEVATGRQADPRSDLYSLGVTLFHMLAGRPPFRGSTAAQVIARHVKEPPPKIQTFRPDLPESLNPTVERLLAKAPDARYQSADALLADLDVLRAVIAQALSDRDTRLLAKAPPPSP